MAKIQYFIFSSHPRYAGPGSHFHAVLENYVVPFLVRDHADIKHFKKYFSKSLKSLRKIELKFNLRNRFCKNCKSN